ncbi:MULTISPECIES: hypothetical protein [unclassified Bradyrhizobium]|uniref:hypothetical protein n=1 Tax=unclassified Bradyrhizobium TaxID=2631580 RepID=UPI0015C9C6FB|nr:MULTISPECIES: hypothetical protein [unclassified Bradyrhizobium]MBB4260523.1 hypothetical protein [Bradyrhizobium sp. CIR3A]NYG46793.1 hypothetical protein [Bradyrhizobium sp. IAR9]
MPRYQVVATHYGSYMVVDVVTPDPVYGVCGGHRLVCETCIQTLAENIAAASNSIADQVGSKLLFVD